MILIFEHSNDAPHFFRDPSIRSNVGRILKIWAERKVYDPEFMEEINSLLGKLDIVVHPKGKLLLSNWYGNFTAKKNNRSCGKISFSQVSVCQSVWGRGGGRYITCIMGQAIW